MRRTSLWSNSASGGPALVTADCVYLPRRAWGGPLVDGAAGRESACFLPDGRTRVMNAGRLQGGDGAAIGVDELPASPAAVLTNGRIPGLWLTGFVIVETYPADSAGSDPRSANRPRLVSGLPGFAPSLSQGAGSAPVPRARDVSQSRVS